MRGSPDEICFVQALTAPLAQGDTAEALRRLWSAWPAPRLAELLGSEDSAVVELAARCLGLVGTMRQNANLTALLGHPEPTVVRAAEDALWSVWMRAGSDDGNEKLRLAVSHLQAERTAEALAILQALTQSEPTFAEPHHQLATVFHAAEDLDRAAQYYGEALRLNSLHYAAAAGLGHVAVEQDDLVAALRHYRRALHIHPRLTEIRALVPRLDAALERRDVA